jgi:hypothetical protein
MGTVKIVRGGFSGHSISVQLNTRKGSLWLSTVRLDLRKNVCIAYMNIEANEICEEKELTSKTRVFTQLAVTQYGFLIHSSVICVSRLMFESRHISLALIRNFGVHAVTSCHELPVSLCSAARRSVWTCCCRRAHRWTHTEMYRVTWHGAFLYSAYLMMSSVIRMTGSEWIMNWNVEWIRILRYCIYICRERLIKTIKASVSIVGVSAEIRTRYLPNTRQKNYSLSLLAR